MGKKQKCYIDIHALQVLPPSCVNRDDTGAPKSVIYGGVPRARVSSQSWKRASRLEFPDEYVGKRTLKVPAMIAASIMEKDPSKTEEDALKLANLVLLTSGAVKEKEKAEDGDDAAAKPKGKGKKKGDDSAGGKTGAAMFVSLAQVDALAAQALIDPKDKAAARKALSDNITADIAMFGRMVAASATLGVDASVEVGHAFSTHVSHTEYDYFAAVDDMNDDDETGAGHVGTAEFNSAVVYRYSNLDVTALKEQIGDEAVEAAVMFVRSFITSMPSGKVHSFANRTRPDYIRIFVREDPVSFAAAFEEPVKNPSGGFFKKSVEALQEYEKQDFAHYGSAPLLALDFSDGNFDEILEKLRSDIAARI